MDCLLRFKVKQVIVAISVEITCKQQEKWMGNRPSTIDSLPVIDQCFNGKVLLAFGHQHLGLTQAAITADLISELVADKPTSVNIAPFTLQRFA
ncbi:D-amino acid dehydrogenase, small subunit [Vibrio parahaemolyticus AQ3810]|nr:D-amino acid dehydrogenase, small subunit [Vibrio parahaemolyticus AQ3810]